MKRFVLIVAITLVAAACGGDGDDDTTTTAAAAATTTTTAAPEETTTTTAAPEETTTTTAAPEETTTTTAAGDDGAAFAVSEVAFGDDGYVAITNIGTAAGNLEGWWLCQRPSYFGLPAHELAPGTTVYVTVSDDAAPDVDGEIISGGGRYGGLVDASGEIGLYLDSSFDSSSSIVSYVEWGGSGHGRSGTAVAAGIWGDGDFVASEGVALIRATTAPPLGAADWETG